MIGKSLKQIVDGLNNYLGAIYNPGLPGYENEYAVIKHLKKDSFDANGSKKIAVNLINIEEDTVYKNQLNPLPPNSGQLTHAMPGIAAMRIKMYVPVGCSSLTSKSITTISAWKIRTTCGLIWVENKSRMPCIRYRCWKLCLKHRRLLFL